jgi:hypothetical protein
VIDLDAVEKEDTVLKVSSFFKKINTVILEDHDYALIGNISAIQVSEEYIFVLDSHIAKILFVFDKAGKFVRQIGPVSNSPVYNLIDEIFQYFDGIRFFHKIFTHQETLKTGIIQFIYCYG